MADIRTILQTSTWHGGQLLAFSAIDGPTDFSRGLVGRTAFEEPGIDFKLPGSCEVRFSSGPRMWVTGDAFGVEGGDSPARGAFLDAHHFLIEGRCRIGARDESVSVVTRGTRTLVAATSSLDSERIDADMDAVIRARCSWLSGRKLPAGLSSRTRCALVKALSALKTQVYTPEGRIRCRWTTPDRWPHRFMWLWDSVFHAIGWRHVDTTVARDAVSAVLDTQREDGFISHMSGPESGSAITQPPVLALGVKLVNDRAPDLEWVRSLYPKLCAYIEWDLNNRDSDGKGLVEWFIEGDPLCRSGESGLDNSPRFDAATQLDAVDFNSYLALECEILAGFAASLGIERDAALWRSRHSTLCAAINERLWSDEARFYLDYDVNREVHSPILACTGFLPLICGAASPAQAAHLARHLEDPEVFGTAFPVPTVAKKQPGYYAKDMWRGPTWVNLNWLIAYGFERYGMREQASRIRELTMQEIEERHDQYGVLFEFYDDRREVDPPELLRKGKCAPGESPYHQVIHDYGWTAALYVDMVHSERNTG